MTSIELIGVVGGLFALMVVINVAMAILVHLNLISQKQASKVTGVIGGLISNIDTIVAPGDSGDTAKKKVVDYLNKNSATMVDPKKAKVLALKQQIKEAKKG